MKDNPEHVCCECGWQRHPSEISTFQDDEGRIYVTCLECLKKLPESVLERQRQIREGEWK